VSTITLYSISWNGYWEKYSDNVIKNISNFNKIPDEIVVVSDAPIDLSKINHSNIKNIVFKNPPSYRPHYAYRNLAIENSSSDWIVALDLDDIQLPNYLDDLDNSADIHGFAHIDIRHNVEYYPKENALDIQIKDTSGTNQIPGTSAIKKYVFDKIKYEPNCYEDDVFYKTASKLNLKVSYDDNIKFIYNGFHPDNNHNELERISSIYKKILNNNRNLYCFWFSGDINEKRKNSINILSTLSGVNVVLIDYDKFYKYENSEIPIHKGFKYLSDVHKSDYARAYMMYFYGEGYTDIKANSFNWNPYFDSLYLSKFSAAGYAEKKHEDIGKFWGNDKAVESYVIKNYSKFIGMGHFIFKPKTKIAYDWLMSIHKLLDKNYDQLKNNPGIHPYNILGGVSQSYSGDIDKSLSNKNYPFAWSEICGDIFHRLQYENTNSVFLSSMPYVNILNYR